MNLRNEFQEARLRAIEKKATTANEVMAKQFIENTIIPNLREQQKWHTTANYFVVTYCMQNQHGNVTYNSRQTVGYNVKDPIVYSNEEVLIQAVVQAELYGITAYQFHEETFTFYRFEIRI